jgi:branched-chain amino acid transport system substrate-binding protein
MSLTHTLLAALLAAGLLADPARAHIPDDRIDIGVIADGVAATGQNAERGAVIAAAMAADDFGRAAGSIDVEVHDSPDAGGSADDLAQVRQWLDADHVALVVDAAGSAEDAAIARLLQSRHRMLITADPGADPAGALCAPDVLKWGADPAVLARAVARTLADQRRRRIFLLAAQDGRDASLLRDLAASVPQDGGTIAGTALQPSGARDLTQQLQTVSASDADALVLLLQGPELQQALRLAQQDGITDRMTVVAPLATVTDIAAAGLPAASSVLVVSGFYWDQDAATRRFAARFRARLDQRRPDPADAAVYSAVLAYLRAARARHSIDAETILDQLRRDPPRQTLFGPVDVLPDGQVAHAMHVFRVRRAAGPNTSADVFAPVATIAADRTIVESCAARQAAR